MPKPTDKEFFLRRLRELDGSAGNKALRENLGWEEEKYFRIRKRLIEEGLVEIGRGKGGSVSLSGVGPEPEPETMDAAETPKLERYHYQRIVEKIGKQLSQDFNNAVIELTANRGKRTGGKWSNPDILAVTLQRFDYIAEDEFLLRSYEIKCSNVVDTDAVAEAAAHKRIVQLAYLVVVSSGGDNRVFDPIDSKRRNIEKECMKAGVGLILLSDYDAAVEIEIGLDANNSNIENRDINATIGRLFSEPKQKEIKKLIETSRLGELRKLLPRTE